MGGVSLNPSLFSALFLVVNDTDQGLPLDTGFTSPFLCEGVCVGVKKNCACMSSFSKKKKKRGFSLQSTSRSEHNV